MDRRATVDELAQQRALKAFSICCTKSTMLPKVTSWRWVLLLLMGKNALHSGFWSFISKLSPFEVAVLHIMLLIKPSAQDFLFQ